MDEFWQSFQELNNNPESLSVRESVVQKSITLTKQFNHFSRQMDNLREDLGVEIKRRVSKVNDYTKRIADLNKQIKTIESDTSKQANDLMDKRDGLLDKLSKLADVDYRTDQTNQVNVSLNGLSLVQGKSQNNLVVNETTTSKTSDDGVTYSGVTQYEFEVSGNAAQIKSGEINGLLESRTKIHNYKMNKLDRIARRLMDEVNSQHQSGYGLDIDWAGKSEDVNSLQSAVSPLGTPVATAGISGTGQIEVYADGSAVGTVTINSGDTLSDIATKIDGADGTSGGGSVTASVSGDRLEVNGSGASHISLRNASSSSQINVLERVGMRTPSGGSGNDFFTGTEASNIKVADNIQQSPSNIATASQWGDANQDGTNDFAGDGSNALKIAQLKDDGTISGSNFSDFWQTQSSELGISITRAERMETNQQTLVDNMEQKREAKSGVSLDEEMSNMIKYQHGYQAAAKVISQMNQMFGTLNNIIR
jgi:flagellar hook-associated protein 1 FlgK